MQISLNAIYKPDTMLSSCHVIFQFSLTMSVDTVDKGAEIYSSGEEVHFLFDFVSFDYIIFYQADILYF